MQSYNTYKQNQPHSKSRTVELWAPVSYQISNSNKKWAKNVKRKQLRRDENERDDDRDKQKNVQERNIKKNLIASLITACKEIAKKNQSYITSSYFAWPFLCIPFHRDIHIFHTTSHPFFMIASDIKHFFPTLKCTLFLFCY